MYTRTVGHFESCRYPSVKSQVGFDDAGVAPDYLSEVIGYL